MRFSTTGGSCRGRSRFIRREGFCEFWGAGSRVVRF